MYRVGRCAVLPEDGAPVPKHVGAILTMNCVLCFVFYCTCSSVFVGQYIKYMNMHGMIAIKYLCFS